MMKTHLVALVALLGCFLASWAQPPNPEPKKKEQPSGKAVNGLKLSLTANQTEIILKDGKIEKPVTLKLTFTNVTDKAIKLNAFDFHFSRIKGEVKALPADSVKFQRIAADRVPFAPKAEDFPEIKPGQSWTYSKDLVFPGSVPEGLSTFALYSVVKPGEFRVTFTYTSSKIDNPLAADIWIGELVSNEVVITAQEKKEPNKEEAQAAAEMKASIEKSYIILYNLRGPGLQFVTDKKAEVPSPTNTKLLVISEKEATSIIDHLAEQGMFAKAHQPLEGFHPNGWYLQAGPSKKLGRCVWKLGEPQGSILGLPLIRHMLKTLDGDNRTALQDWLKGTPAKK